jgi:hypothetical protein
MLIKTERKRINLAAEESHSFMNEGKYVVK